MTVAVSGKSAEPGLVPLLRGAALPLAVFSGVAHGGSVVVVGLMVVGVVTGGVGGVLLVLWSVFSLFVSLVGYGWMEERRRREAVSALVVRGMPGLASAVIELYPRSVEDPAIVEVFELYRQAQRGLEEGDYRSAGEAIERGIALADGLLAGCGEPVRYEDGEAREEGEGPWR